MRDRGGKITAFEFVSRRDVFEDGGKLGVYPFGVGKVGCIDGRYIEAAKVMCTGIGVDAGDVGEVRDDLEWRPFFHIPGDDFLHLFDGDAGQGGISVVFEIGILCTERKAESVGSVVFQGVWDESMRSRFGVKGSENCFQEMLVFRRLWTARHPN
jgi:hypothetical protein